MVAFGTRLPKSDAEAFERLVRRRSKAATGREDGMSTAQVLAAVMRAAVEAEGLTPKAPAEEAEEDPDPAPEQIEVARAPCPPPSPPAVEEEPPPSSEPRWIEHKFVRVPRHDSRRCSVCEAWEHSDAAIRSCVPRAPAGTRIVELEAGA